MKELDKLSSNQSTYKENEDNGIDITLDELLKLLFKEENENENNN